MSAIAVHGETLLSSDAVADDRKDNEQVESNAGDETLDRPTVLLVQLARGSGVAFRDEPLRLQTKVSNLTVRFGDNVVKPPAKPCTDDSIGSYARTFAICTRRSIRG